MTTTKTRSSAFGSALITGASAGIGKVYADRLGRRGYDLILIARRADKLAAVAGEIREKYGVAVKEIVADLGNIADLRRVLDVVATDPDITMIINNAGTSKMASVAETGTEATTAMTDLNITALVNLSLAAFAAFKARDHGTIINIGSILGFHSLPISSVYSGTKGYVLNFTRGLQDETQGTGVKVQLVLPAATATDIWELAGMSISNLDPATVMTVDNCVDAALAGLDLGETITLPSVENAAELLAAYDNARLALLGGAQTGKTATRYRIAA